MRTWQLIFTELSLYVRHSLALLVIIATPRSRYFPLIISISNEVLDSDWIYLSKVTRLLSGR